MNLTDLTSIGNIDAPVAYIGISICLAVAIAALTWGLARSAARGDTYPAPPQPTSEYEATAHRWNPPRRDDYPFDQEAAAGVAALEDWVNEPGRHQDGAA